MSSPDRFTVPDSVRENQQRRATARRPQPCGACQQWTSTVLYPCGWRCATCVETHGLTPVHAHRKDPA